jgi:hypothetical protein
MNINKKSILLTFLGIQLLSGMLLFINPLNANAQADFLNLGDQLTSNNNETGLASLFSTQEDLVAQNSSSNQEDVSSPIMTFPDGEDGLSGQDGKDGNAGLAGKDGNAGLSGQDGLVIP